MKCPFCGANLAENARFCLYCMTSLEEKRAIETKQNKNKRWLVILATVLVFVLVMDSIWFTRAKKQPATVSNGIFTEKKTTEDTSFDTSENNNGIADDGTAIDGDSASAQNESQIHSDKMNNSANTPNTGTNHTGSQSTTTPTDKTDTTNVDNNSSVTTTKPATSTVTYIYRDAQYGDDYSVYADLENAVVITGVRTPSLSGEYSIPAQIDDKNVIAVMGSAFCDDNIKDTVKKVIVPSTVKTIWNYAFAKCYNLTDIYFCGNSIYTESAAFAESSKRTGTLTIHCSANCSDRNYRYYKNSALNYDAKYEEWNG